jgi:hypothetical protein
MLFPCVKKNTPISFTISLHLLPLVPGAAVALLVHDLGASFPRTEHVPTVILSGAEFFEDERVTHVKSPPSSLLPRPDNLTLTLAVRPAASAT